MASAGQFRGSGVQATHSGGHRTPTTPVGGHRTRTASRTVVPGQVVGDPAGVVGGGDSGGAYRGGAYAERRPQPHTRGNGQGRGGVGVGGAGGVDAPAEARRSAKAGHATRTGRQVAGDPVGVVGGDDYGGGAHGHGKGGGAYGGGAHGGFAPPQQPYVGRLPPPSPYGNGKGHGGRGVGEAVIVDGPVDDGMILAIFAFLCCCWCLGLVALLKSMEVGKANNMGNYDLARKLRAEAMCWSYASIVLGGCVWFWSVGIWLIMLLVGTAASA